MRRAPRAEVETVDSLGRQPERALDILVKISRLNSQKKKNSLLWQGSLAYLISGPGCE